MVFPVRTTSSRDYVLALRRTKSRSEAPKSPRLPGLEHVAPARGPRRLTQAVASGEVWAANSGNIATLKQLEEQGAPIAYAFPDPSYANPQAAAALASSKRPNAALLFLDFAMSPEGQAALNGHSLGASAIPGLEGTLQLENFRILDPNKYPPEVRDQWQAKFEQNWRQ